MWLMMGVPCKNKEGGGGEGGEGGGRRGRRRGRREEREEREEGGKEQAGTQAHMLPWCIQDSK